MNAEFTRRELYDLVWSQPMKTIAAEVGISDVALAKQCKKADIPVPNRGYWAQKQAGKPTIQVALPHRFPGGSDRVGGASPHHSYYGSGWAEEFTKMPIPPPRNERVEIRTRGRQRTRYWHHHRSIACSIHDRAGQDEKGGKEGTPAPGLWDGA